MKVKYLCIFLILITGGHLFSFENDDVIIKRKIAVLPFSNTNDVVKYNYVKETLRDSLKSKLLNTELFTLMKFSEIDTETKKSDGIDEGIIKKIGKKIRADIIVNGKYVIIKDRIMVQIDAFDIKQDTIIASTNLTGEVGLDLFRIIDSSSEDIKNKIVEKVTLIPDAPLLEDPEPQTQQLQVIPKPSVKKLFPTIKNKTGLAFAITGTTLSLAGIPFLIYDFVYFGNVVLGNAGTAPRSSTGEYDFNTGYSTYTSSYRMYLAFLCTGISSISTGLIFLIVSIPLLAYKHKNKTVSICFDYNNRLTLSYAIKL